MATIKGLADQIFQGHTLEIMDAAQILETCTTQELVAEADRLKTLLHGDKVSFVHNACQNITNICFHECCICRFQAPLESDKSFVVDSADVIGHLHRHPGVTELFMQGGVFPKLRFDYYRDLVRDIKKAFPRIHLNAFSPTEVEYLAEDTGLSTAKVLADLKQLGLDSMPGTAAEILVDEIRAAICSVKIDSQTWVRIIREAHMIGIQTSATLLFGHLEKPVHVVKHLGVIRDLQRETRGFTEFVPCMFEPEGTRLADRIPKRSAAERKDYAARVYAMSRLFLGRDIPHIQMYWPSLGLETALEGLRWGCDDFSGTNFTASPAGDTNPIPQMEVAELQRALEAAGHHAWQRDTLYRPIPANIAVA